MLLLAMKQSLSLAMAVSSLAIAAVVFPAASSAQSWSQPTPSGSQPSSRIFHALSFDGARDRAVLFGGYNGSTEFNDTWEWNPSAGTWSQRSPGTSPSIRQVMAFAYDAARGRTVMWGGFSNSGGFRSDTWEWDGTNWTQVAASGPIPGRCAAAMVYDSQRQRVILFGGQGQTNFANDVWEWDGATWTQTFAGGASGPSPRFFHNMVYDSGRRRVVMFGGNNNSNLVNDTWSWNPQTSTWTQIASTGPSARGQFGMIYDPSLDRTLLYGGENASQQSLGDCWILDGDTWTQSTSTSTPPARRRHAIAYRPNTGKSLMFGGQQGGVINETWNLDTSSDARTDDFVPTLRTTTNPPVALRDFMAAPLPTGGALVYGGTTAMGRQPFTYVLSGTTFTLQLPNVNPAFRADAALGLDLARGNNVLFGGRNPAGVALGDTWTFASGQWTLMAPAVAPPARSGHGFAYDATANVLLMFGGVDAANQPLGDFWAWDGTTWTQRTPSQLPSARSQHAMTFDGRRSRVVLHGGIAGTTRLSDIWEYDGANWIDMTAVRKPSERHGGGMVYDSGRGRIVFFGGRDGAGFFNDTWELVNSTGPAVPGYGWTRLTAPNAPSVRNSVGMAYDAARSETVLFGGFQGAAQLGDTWTFNGTTWSQKTPATNPPVRSAPGMAYDAARSRAVMFGGFNPTLFLLADTWEWDGTNWTLRNTATSPPGRLFAGMAYDSVRQRMVMFGGQGAGSALLGDTWEYNGTTWTLVSNTGPSPRQNAMLAFDPVRNQTVLFGGGSAAGTNNQTWVWNGTTWTQKSPATAPVGRYAQMAFDASRGRVVVYGGANGNFTTNYSDTWEWDGSNWAPAPLARGDGLWNAGARSAHAMTYDSRSERVVLFGGDAASGCKDDVWSWNGDAWIRHLAGAASPSARSGAQVWFDASVNEVRLMGGGCGSTFQNDLWSLQLPVYSRWEAYGQGCVGSLGSPTLFVDGASAPIVGTTLNLRLTNIPGVILPAVAAYGYSRTLWNGLPLPVDLAAVGLPGCNLYNSAEATFGLTAPNGTGTILWPVQIPNNPALLGGEVFLQTLQFELPGFPRWGAVSNGVAVRIGDR